MITLPDILHLEPRITVDQDAVGELLELAFLGKDDAKGLDRRLGEVNRAGNGWQLDLFAEDLFVRELIRDCFTIELDGVRFPVNQTFLYGVLSDPPTDAAAVAFRQDVLTELENDDELLDNARRLYKEVSLLLRMFMSPDHAAKLDVHAFRLDLLRQARWVIDWLVDGFSSARSGLERLARAGREIQRSADYAVLADLLDFERRQSTLKVRLDVGGSGQITYLRVDDLEENRANRFYRAPWRRLVDKLRMLVFYGYRLDNSELMNRLLHDVYRRISPALNPLVQLVGQLELYLSAIAFRQRMEAEGFAMSLASFDSDRPLELERVFNPLLLDQREPPVPCDLKLASHRAVTLVTGPNSGGKTRLLQTVGLAQLLGQSGLYVPARSANLPLIHGLFVSLVESETAHQAEGRLGREMLRIRSLFEAMGSPSMVILDELCSGTNPREGSEIFELVVKLLGRLETVAFISTHFLDLAHRLEREPPTAALEFLQVETEGEASTYQFVPGVAVTSLAAETAERLGVTFEQLSELIDRRGEQSDRQPAETAEVVR